MNWNRLKNMKCAQCNGRLEDREGLWCCVKCDFSITYSRFDTLVSDLYKPKFQRERYEEDEDDEELLEYQGLMWPEQKDD